MNFTEHIQISIQNSAKEIAVSEISSKQKKMKMIRHYWRISKIIFSYFHNTITIFQSALLCYTCYYDYLMIYGNQWKLYATITIFVSFCATISFNFIYFTNFMFNHQYLCGDKKLKPWEFMFLMDTFKKNQKNYSHDCGIRLLTRCIGFFDIFFNISSSNIRLLIYIILMNNSVKYPDALKAYNNTYKILFIGLFFFEIPQGVISIYSLQTTYKYVISPKITSTTFVAIFTLCRIVFTLLTNIYSIMKGSGILDRCKKEEKKNKEFDEKLVVQENEK